MQNAHNPSYQRLPIPPKTRMAAPPPLPGSQQVNVPPTGGMPVEQFRQPPQAPAAPIPQQIQPQQQVQPQAQPKKSLFQKKTEARQELQQAIGHSNEILVRAQTVFPFMLFPDTITIDRGTLTISHRSFFKIAEVISIRIEDILNTTANVGPFFGSLKITTRFFGTDKDYTINYLRRNDALKIKQILQGYIIALRKNIDCSALSPNELARMLSELGAEAPRA
jgi:hypothetical protein